MIEDNVSVICEETNKYIFMETFIELMDDIYYVGYAKFTAVDDPEKLQFELNEFLNNYGLGLEGS